MMLNNCNRCRSLFVSRVIQNIRISARCTYSTMLQQNASNEVISIKNILDKPLSEWSADDVTNWLSSIDD